jgi:hypothetical protein
MAASANSNRREFSATGLFHNRLRGAPIERGAGQQFNQVATGPRATAGAWAHVPPESVLLFHGSACAPKSWFSVTLLLPLRRGGLTSIAVDILYVNGHGDKSRKVAHESVDLFPKNLRSTQAYGSRPPWRIVTSGKCDMQKSL